VKSLFDEVAPLYKDIQGGYTRIMPLGNRRGDGARMVIMELTKRTIPDKELLGIEEKTPKVKTKKKEKDETEKPAKLEEKTHVAPEVDIEAKEERVASDIKKEQAKKEQKKITKKGIFRRFRRKSMG
jgi:large subunit ribosomal protein L17